MTERVRTWLAQWGPMLPLLLAEGTIWLGFGALLPILPIYFTQHGVDLPTLGVVVAAWPAARLLGEPFFGWVADRASRKRMMMAGLLLASVFAVLPLFIVGPTAFIVLRGLAGLAAAMYDPAARGYLVDANPPEKRGEAFGLYNAAQMGGLMLGPAIGGFAVAITGLATVVFWVAGIALVVSAVLVAFRVPDLQHPAAPARDATAEPATATQPGDAYAPGDAVEPAPADPRLGEARPRRLFNRLLVAAVAFNLGGYFASGSYEVVWSLYLTSLGASMALIGLTFFSFAFPVLVLSPYFGKHIDRSGGFVALVLGLFVVGLCGAAYVLVPEIWFVILVGFIEGTAFAVCSPALYLLVARASPPGRSSTAQGIFGAAGTMGTIVAALAAGVLAEADLRYPYIATTIGMLAVLGIGLLIGGRRLYDAMQPDHELRAATPPAGTTVAGA